MKNVSVYCLLPGHCHVDFQRLDVNVTGVYGTTLHEAHCILMLEDKNERGLTGVHATPTKTTANLCDHLGVSRPSENQ